VSSPFFLTGKGGTNSTQFPPASTWTFSGAGRCDPALDLSISAIHIPHRKGETLTKGKTVTKPIELGLKPADEGKQSKTDKTGSGRAKTAEDSGGEVTIMPPRARKSAPKPEIVAQIGQQLARVYKDVVDQPVPDRFLDLLKSLEQGSPTATSGTAQGAGAPNKAPKGSQP
jgi:hypothetical protein